MEPPARYVLNTRLIQSSQDMYTEILTKLTPINTSLANLVDASNRISCSVFNISSPGSRKDGGCPRIYHVAFHG